MNFHPGLGSLNLLASGGSTGDAVSWLHPRRQEGPLLTQAPDHEPNSESPGNI